MKMKSQEILIKTFPKFFSHLSNDEKIIMPIRFGIECDNGWYWLLYQLMNTINGYCEANNVPHPQITQIKEKFGSLRFYYNGGDEKIDGMVWLAESMSDNICENCGTTENVGKTNGWIYTLCEKCHKENNRANNYMWKKN